MNTRFRSARAALGLAGVLMAAAMPASATEAAAPAPAPEASSMPAAAPVPLVRQAPLAPVDALAVIEGASPPQVLDVRSADEFAAGHVPGAVLIPHDELAVRLAELDKARPVLVYCRSGRRSTIAEDLLAAEGFQVRQIDGSWLRWQEEKLPVQMPGSEPETEDAE